VSDQSSMSMSSPEVRELLEHERFIAPLPSSVRAHVIARARAALVAEPVPVRRTLHMTSGNRWAAAAAMIAVTAVTAVAAGAAAYAIRAQRAPSRDGGAIAAAPRVSAPAPRVTTAARRPEPRTEVQLDGQPALELAPTAAMPRPSRVGALRAELRLLQRARAAVAGERFGAALIPIDEHARQFKDGRLAEEREALRVKALAALGRSDEARRAAAAFQSRFPRSVLSPAVSRVSAPEISRP